MLKYLILSFGLFLAVFRANSQVRFGVAAGYESVNISNPFASMNGGGVAYNVFTVTPLSRHFELHADLAASTRRTSYTYLVWNSGGLPDGEIYPFTVGTKITHIVLPVQLCYSLPVEKAHFFAGAGIFASYTRYSRDESAQPFSYGPSFTGGVRFHCGITLLADYRPYFHPPVTGDYVNASAEQPITEIKNDFSFRVGYLFGGKGRPS